MPGSTVNTAASVVRFLRHRLDPLPSARKNRTVPDPPEAPPPGARSSTLRYRVPFYDTDAMRVVHHANFARYLELARIQFLDEHDVPYREYVNQGLHFAVTEIELVYKRAASFDDALDITCWAQSVGGASLRIGYAVRRQGELIAVGATGHAMVTEDGRPARIPKRRRDHLRNLLGS
jgi:acyl-CoA thioester hydrolase